LRYVGLLTSALALALAAEENTYVGAQTCAGCHPKHSRLQSKSEHAAALRSVSDHPLASRFSQKHTAYRPPDYRLEWYGNEVRALDRTNTLTLPVQWAFGAGQQAVTFLSQVDEDRYVEHHLSYYASARSMSVTPGHRGVRPDNLTEAAGVLYPTFAPDSAVMRCFQCHSTGPLKLGKKLELIPHELGVRCESCHGPGAAHVQAAGKAKIFNPGKVDGASMNSFCGNCHRPPAGTVIDWTDPWNVRHQPVYLSRSACFIQSAGKLRCTSCHDPHSALELSAQAYNAQCADCHTKPHRPGSNCVSCHMPKVQPQANLSFTNHWIGIFNGTDKLRPAVH
jgi:hypothetical protein